MQLSVPARGTPLVDQQKSERQQRDKVDVGKTCQETQIIHPKFITPPPTVVNFHLDWEAAATAASLLHWAEFE